MEAVDIVPFVCALCNMFKRTAVDNYGRHTGSRVKLKVFFCLCLRNDCCNIIGNRLNLKTTILPCKAEFGAFLHDVLFQSLKNARSCDVFLR